MAVSSPSIYRFTSWMDASPIEISAINSLWSAEKKKTVDFNTDDALFDFNVGYIGTAILAVFFVALGALIQYPTGKPVEAASAKYIAQFVMALLAVRWASIAFSTLTSDGGNLTKILPESVIMWLLIFLLWLGARKKEKK